MARIAGVVHPVRRLPTGVIAAVSSLDDPQARPVVEVVTRRAGILLPAYIDI